MCDNCKYALAPKCQVDNLLCAWDFQYALPMYDVCISLQADLNQKESQVAELQDTVKFQQTAASNVKDELTLALANMEKLKKDFQKERADWDAERVALEKRAVDVENALNPLSEELTGLK